jgi:hypothetical protein
MERIIKSQVHQEQQRRAAEQFRRSHPLDGTPRRRRLRLPRLAR